MGKTEEKRNERKRRGEDGCSQDQPQGLLKRKKTRL